MQNYLVFHLYGPLAAWGDIAVGETRPSYGYPTKSAIMGIIAAALGIQREQEETLFALNHDYGFAVRVDITGEPIQDYHTSQVPPQSALKKMPHATRREELAMPDKNTILSTRTYYCDAVYSVVLWAEKDSSLYSLEQIALALRQPHFVLYLGRKACPLALPVQAKLLQACSIQAALQQSDESWLQVMHGPLKNLPKTKRQRLYWDVNGCSGIKATHTLVRQDQLTSRKRWQYTERYENVADNSQ